MIEFFKDLFAYHDYYNQKLVEMLSKHQEQISERSIPMLSHMINAHQIWNSRILGTSSFGVNDVRSIDENKLQGERNYRTSLEILENLSLDHTIYFGNAKGDQFQNSVQEILFHVTNHHTHHRAQLVSDLRENGITPFMSDYILYKR